MQKFSVSEKIWLPLVLVGAFLLGILLAWIGNSVFGLFSKKGMINKAHTTANLFVSATVKPVNKNNPQTGIYNALLLGYGGGVHDGTYLTDSIIVIHVDTNVKKATLISIPRDLWVPGNEKLNAVAAFSGFANVGPAVTNVTGLPINYYVAIDFDQFTKLIDNLSGMTITMPNSLDDQYYPITGQEGNTCGFSNDQINQFKAQYSGFDLEKQFTCRYEHLQYSKGQILNLDGATVLKIARSRHGDSDFARSLRQFAILQGVANKLISLRSLGKIDDTVNTLFAMVKTDLDLGTIKSLGQIFMGDYKVSQIQLTTDNVLIQGTSSDGQFILNPKAGEFNFSEVKNYLNSRL